MKRHRHVTLELEADELHDIIHGEIPFDIDVSDADSISITTRAQPQCGDLLDGIHFVDAEEASDQDVNAAIGGGD